MNTTSLIMSKVAIIETWRQPTGVVVTQSLDVDITITWIETVVVPNMDVVKRGIIIRYAAKLGSGSGGILARWKLNGVQHY
jgi:hypothetical protein